MEATDNGQVVAEHGRSLVLTISQQRRLYRLYARAELAVEDANAARSRAEGYTQTFNDALAEAFDTAGIPFEMTDQYQIEWRSGRVLLQEAGP